MTTTPIEERRLLVLRSVSQLLDRKLPGGPDAVEAGVRALLAVQAQDKSAWRLALRARVAAITAADVDRALTEKRSLVVAWLNRGTLHLVCSDDYPWLLALTAPTHATANRRRLVQEGLTTDAVERGVACIDRSLAEDGPLTRAQLRERLSSAGVRTEGQALVHLLFAAVTRGLAVMGPMVAGQHAFAHAKDWLPGAAAAGRRAADDRDRALAELARRYLRGHGSAADGDLARWSGLPLRDARAGLRSIGGELAELGYGLVDLADRRAPAVELGSELLPPRLLPAFDPLLLGWREREPILRAADEPRVIPPGGGVLRAFATINGVAGATWRIRRQGNKATIQIEPFDALGDDTESALRAEARDVARFEGRILAG